MTLEESIQARVKEILAAAKPPTPEFVAGFIALLRGFRREDEATQVDEDAA